MALGGVKNSKEGFPWRREGMIFKLARSSTILSVSYYIDKIQITRFTKDRSFAGDSIPDCRDVAL